jgi:hypothetical protein
MTALLLPTQRFVETFIGLKRDGLRKGYRWHYSTPFVYVGDEEVVLDTEHLKAPAKLDDWIYHVLTEGDDASTYNDFRLTREEARCKQLEPGMSLWDPELQATEWCLIVKFPMFNAFDFYEFVRTGRPEVFKPRSTVDPRILARARFYDCADYDYAE